LKLASDFGISVLVVWDLDHFVNMESFWDRELCDRVDDPFLSGCMMDLHWKLGQRVGLILINTPVQIFLLMTIVKSVFGKWLIFCLVDLNVGLLI